MPTLQEIETAVATLSRENRRISIRNVRSVLPRGGSYSDIGPVLSAWKERTNYIPKVLAREVPSSVATSRDEFAARLWAVARDEAEKSVAQDRAAIADIKREYVTEAAVAWAEVDRLTDEVTQLKQLIADAGIHVVTASDGRLAFSMAVSPAGAGDLGVDKKSDQEPASTRETRQSKRDRTRRYREAVLMSATLAISNSKEGALTAPEILATMPPELRTQIPDGKILRANGLHWLLVDWTRAGVGIVERDNCQFGLLSST